MVAAGGLMAAGPFRALAATQPGFGSIAAGRGPALVGVTLRRPEDFAALAAFDLTECRHGNEIQVVAWPGDGERLRALGLPVRVIEADLAALDRAIAAEDIAQMSAAARISYRRLADYEADLRALAATYPGHVRLVSGSIPTAEGRTVWGVEIAENVNQIDGRPTSFIMGLHHAREWPSAELTMDLATDLATNYGRLTQVTNALRNARVLIVPVVNPDGFTYSRDFPVEVSQDVEGQTATGAYWRKNRRGVTAAAGQSLGAYGVDPNRNYGYMWGGGSVSDTRTSSLPAMQTYQGDAAFSEPEPRNVREWVLSRHVTTLITNHTFSNLVLWPWGSTYSTAPDADLLRSLGNKMAAFNRYEPMQSIYLYPTTGSTEDWAYAATGTLGYTFEHGSSFHPRYSQVPTMYSKNRGAFLAAIEAAADPAKHGIIAGRVTAGGNPVVADLELRRVGMTPTSDGPQVEDAFVTTTRTKADGTFEWHVNPSTRPVASSPEPFQLRVFGSWSSDPVAVTVGRGQRVDVGTIAV